MNRIIPKKILIAFVFLFVLKITLAYFITHPFTIDSYSIIKMSKSFFETRTFAIGDNPTHHYPPLSSIVLSSAYIFKDYGNIYFSMQLINSFISSLAIIPVYLISRNFIDEKNSIVLSVIISFLPLNFYYPIGFILTEHAFNVLFLFMVYFIHKAITQNSIKWQLVAGFLLGLCLLSRYISFTIFPAVILTLLIRQIYYSNYKSPLIIGKNFIKSLIHYLPFFIISFGTFTPWLLRNGMLFGFTTSGIIGYTSEISSIEESVSIGLPFFLRLIQEFFAHVGELIYASGIIFFVMSIFTIREVLKDKEYKNGLPDFVILSFSITLMYVFLSSYHNAMLTHISYIRILPRYIEVALPLIYIIGYIGLLEYQKYTNRKYLNDVAYFLASLVLLLFLLPVQGTFDLSMVSIGMLYRLDYVDILFSSNIISSHIASNINLIKVLVFTTITFGWILLLRKNYLNPQHVIIFIFTMLLITNSIGFTGSVLQQKMFSSEIGTWYNDNTPDNPGIVLFDERDVNIYFLHDGISNMGFWINAPIRTGNVTLQNENIEFIVSSHVLDLPVMATEKTQDMFLNCIVTTTPEKNIYLYKL